MLQEVKVDDLGRLEKFKVMDGKLTSVFAERSYTFKVSSLGNRYSIEVERADGVKMKFESTVSDGKLKCFLWHDQTWKQAVPGFWAKNRAPDKTTITVGKTTDPARLKSLVSGTAEAADYLRPLAFSRLDDAMNRFFAVDFSTSARLENAKQLLDRWSEIALDFRGNKIANNYAKEMENAGRSDTDAYKAGLGKTFDDLLKPLEKHVAALSLRELLKTDPSSLDNDQLIRYAKQLQKEMGLLDTLEVSGAVKTSVIEDLENVRNIVDDPVTSLEERIKAVEEFLPGVKQKLALDQFIIRQDSLDKLRSELAGWQTNIRDTWSSIRAKANTEGMFQLRVRRQVTPSSTLAVAMEAAPLRAGAPEVRRVTTPRAVEVRPDAGPVADARTIEASAGPRGAWQANPPVLRAKSGSCAQEESSWKQGARAAAVVLLWGGVAVASCYLARVAGFALAEEGAPQTNCRTEALGTFTTEWTTLREKEKQFAPYRSEYNSIFFP
ncbi:MAG: hypothetical protein HYW48_08980 [Deltaproteobacteria bacterium]|nr:hypothetical protein [Deltaproteobacteria bacterium]